MYSSPCFRTLYNTRNLSFGEPLATPLTGNWQLASWTLGPIVASLYTFVFYTHLEEIEEVLVSLQILAANRCENSSLQLGFWKQATLTVSVKFTCRLRLQKSKSGFKTGLYHASCQLPVRGVVRGAPFCTCCNLTLTKTGPICSCIDADLLASYAAVKICRHTIPQSKSFKTPPSENSLPATGQEVCQHPHCPIAAALGVHHEKMQHQLGCWHTDWRWSAGSSQHRQGLSSRQETLLQDARLHRRSQASPLNLSLPAPSH
jgi:hypothetical protein